MFKPKLLQQEQGFTLVEVLVAILITLLFVSVAMQTIVIAAVFKVRAQEFTEATTWIQEDIENVKYNAANLQYTLLDNETDPVGSDTDPANHEIGDTKLYVTSVYGFKVNDTLKIGTDSTNYIIQSIPTNTTITLAPPLVMAHPKEQLVISTTGCSAASLDIGFADRLRDWITYPNTSGLNPTTGTDDQSGDTNFVNIPKTSSRTSKEFTLKRTTTISSGDLASVSPHNSLRLIYDVSPNSGGSSVAKFYTEVIPNVALQCP